jgi:hypothetical protein
VFLGTGPRLRPTVPHKRNRRLSSFMEHGPTAPAGTGSSSACRVLVARCWPRPTRFTASSRIRHTFPARWLKSRARSCSWVMRTAGWGRPTPPTAIQTQRRWSMSARLSRIRTRTVSTRRQGQPRRAAIEPTESCHESRSTRHSSVR